jgi:guanylate kinase
MREGEKDGREYYFISRKELIKRRREGYFAESARVHLDYYGTPKKPLEKALAHGDVILLDVDVKGAASIKKNYPQALSIFILPPSEAELRRRLKRRGTETREQVRLRLQNAIAEMREFNRFDYVIINKDINEAVAAADHMIKSWTVGVTYFGRNKSKAYQVIR